MAKKSNQDPTAKKRAFMGLASKDLRKLLKANPQLGDPWVRRQLEKMGKGNLFFEGVAQALRHNDVGTESSYRKLKKLGGPTETAWKGTMSRQTESLKRRLEEYKDDPEIAANPDEYVKRQLEKHGKGDYYFPGAAEAIKSKRVGTEASYRRNPEHQKYIAQPENQEAATRLNKRHGDPYTQQISTLKPYQEEFQQSAAQALMPQLLKAYSKIGEPVPLEQPVNQAMMQLLDQYQKGTLGNEHLSGWGAFPGLQQNLQGLSQGAQQLGQGAYSKGQQAYNAINPYLQQAGSKGRDFLQQAQSTLQPFAKQAAAYGNNIFSEIQGPAQQLGSRAQDSLGSLLSMLNIGTGGR